MTLEQLHNKLEELGIPADSYYLHGLFGSTSDRDKPSLTIRMGKYTVEYEIYCRKRSEKSSIGIFTSAHEACDYLLKMLTERGGY